METEATIQKRGILYADVGDFLLKLCLVVAIATIFFNTLIPSSTRIRYVVLILAIGIALVRIGSSRVIFKFTLPAVLWIIFFLFVLLNGGIASGSGTTWFITFPLCAILGAILCSDSRRWIDFIVSTIAIFACIHAIATILFWIFPSIYSVFRNVAYSSEIYIAQEGYKAGLTTHYSTNGMYLAFGLVSAFTLTLRHKRTRRWVVLSIVILFALILTTKRAHLVFSLIACLIFYIAMHSGRSLGALFRVALVLIIGVIVVYILSLVNSDIQALLDRFADLTDDDTFGGRTQYYEICWAMWGDSPLIGNGWNSFTETLYSSGLDSVNRLIARGNLTQNAHNVYLQLLAEEGLIGLILFALAAASSLIRTIQLLLRFNRTQSENIFVRCALAWSLGIQIFFLLYCITGNPLYDVYEYTIYMFACSAAFIPAIIHSRIRVSISSAKQMNSQTDASFNVKEKLA